jgi:hypothetical protein
MVAAIERRPWLAALGLVALTLAGHALLLAAPGFYANDEWQKFDHIRLHGFRDFVRAYGALRPGPEFGYPVRPLGFLQQGAAALFMQSAPFASHLVSVLNHALVALTFVWALRRARVPAGTAALAGVLFVLSPLTTMATGWTAASFDQLYVLWLLVAAVPVVQIPDRGVSPLQAAWIVAATSLALLAKETALVAPGVVLLLGYLAWCNDARRFRWRPFGVAFVATLLPVVAYLLFRLPALTATVAGQPTAEYAPDLAHTLDNAWRFFVFPFRLKVVELSAAVFRSPWQPLLAGGAHLLLLMAIHRLFGARYVGGYLAGYFLFLLPVLTLPNPGTQCLYGSALAMALAMAAVTVRLLTTQRRAAAALIAAGAVALFLHSLAIQRQLFTVAQCQTRFLTSLDALLATQPAARSGQVLVVPDPGAPLRVGIRAVAAREAYSADGQPRVVFDEGGRAASGATRARMESSCTVRAEGSS